MNSGFRVLQWARQNGHTVTWMADKLGYSRQRLSDALHHDDISPMLSEALYEHFYLRVMPTCELSQQGEGRRESKSRPDRQYPVGRRGRTPGAGRGPGKSKLDPHLDAITQLLAAGVPQQEIAERYQTTPSNLHNWLKKRGFK